VQRSFLSQELRVAKYGFEHASEAARSNDRLGALNQLRLLAESALRICWIAGDGLSADSDRRPIVDTAAARHRIDALRKRDILHLAGAYAAIHDVRGDDRLLQAELFALAARISAAPAPPNIRQLATSPHATASYVAHRVCSSLVHPGLGMSRVDLMSIETVVDMAADNAYVCVVYGFAILRALGIEISLNWRGMIAPPPPITYDPSPDDDWNDLGFRSWIPE
jgi:hypothetical protein